MLETLEKQRRLTRNQWKIVVAVILDGALARPSPARAPAAPPSALPG